jgi:hypothetical protein
MCITYMYIGPPPSIFLSKNIMAESPTKKQKHNLLEYILSHRPIPRSRNLLAA